MKHSYVILTAGLIYTKNTQIGHKNYSFFWATLPEMHMNTIRKGELLRMIVKVQ